VKFFHPPHLYCVTTLPCKTSTTANIGVKCFHFSRNVMLSVGISRMEKTRLVFIDPGAKVNSSRYCNIVLKKGLLPDIRAICRHYRSTLQQDHGAPAHTARTMMNYLKKAHQLHWTLARMWPPNSPDIILVDYAIWGALSATSLPSTTIQDGGRTEASDSHRVAKTLTAFHW